MQLKLINCVTKERYEFEVEDDKSSTQYYHLELELQEGMPDGSYDYVLYDDNDIKKASGVLQIGEYEIGGSSYDATVSKRIVYEG